MQGPNSRFLGLICGFFCVYATIVAPLGCKAREFHPIRTALDQSTKEQAVVAQSSSIASTEHGIRYEFNLSIDPSLIPADSLVMKVQMATFHKRPNINDAEIIIGESCRFASTAKTIQDNNFLVFHRSDCPAILSSAKVLSIRIHADREIPVAIWGHQARRLKIMRPLQVWQNQGAYVFVPNMVFDTISYSETHSRLSLLTFMWNFEEPRTLVLCFCLAGALLSFAVASLCLYPRKRWLFALAISSATTGIGFTFSLVVPPFQAPDESRHATGFAMYTKDDTWRNQLLKSAFATELPRIKSSPAEIYTAQLLDRPEGRLKLKHNDLYPVQVGWRSDFVKILWSIYDTVLTGVRPEFKLLLFRGLNVLFFATLLGAAVFWLFPVLPKFALMGVFLLPILSFFTMHISDYSPLISFMTILSLISLALPNRAVHLGRLGLGSGLILGGLLAANSSGLIFLCFWFFVVMFKITHIYMLTIDSTTPSRRQVLCFTTLTFGIPLFATAFFSNKYAATLGKITERSHEMWPILPATVAGTLVLLLVFSTAYALTLARWGSMISQGFANLRLEKMVSALVLIATFCTYILSGIHGSGPELDVEQSTLQLTSYIQNFFRNVIVGMTLGDPGFFSTKTFFGGFGWLESFPSDAFIHTTTQTIMLGLLLTQITGLLKQKDPNVDQNMTLWTNGMIMLLALYLVAILVAGYVSGVNIHGRYLVGFYVLLAVHCLVGFDLWGSRHNEPVRQELTARIMFLGLLTCSVFLNGYALNHLLDRYFG